MDVVKLFDILQQKIVTEVYTATHVDFLLADLHLKAGVVVCTLYSVHCTPAVPLDGAWELAVEENHHEYSLFWGCGFPLDYHKTS